MNKKPTQMINDKIFKQYSEDISVFLKSGNSKGSNYDPFRKLGRTIEKQNQVFIKAIVRDVSPEKLISREIGLALTGAKELIIKESDVESIRISQKITIDGEDYYKYHDAIGNKFVIFKRPFGYSRVIIFRKEV